MKAIIITLILISLVVTGGFLAPNYFKEGIMVESVIIDKTDSFLAKPTMNEVLLPLHVDEHKWDLINFRIQTIKRLNYYSKFNTKLQDRIEL